MIIYFADRQLNILGQASTHLPGGVRISSDLKTEEIESGVAAFECDVLFDDQTRADVEAWADVGNYVFRSNDGENELYNITDAKIDTKKQRINFYAEDDGLDLLNDIVGEYSADRPYPISHYIELFAGNSGWQIGINEVEGLTRQLSFENEQTASARLLSVAEAFNNCELSFSFDIEGLTVKKRYINIYAKRGNDTGIQLRLNKEVSGIVISKSISNLATALKPTGGTPDGADAAITLDGYTYDDGDFYVEGGILKSRKALEKWRRYLWRSDTSQLGGHITRSFSYDTTSQAVLCEAAIAELKKICDAEVNYEADITKFPETVKVGDRVNIIDDKGELYLSSRILTLKSSVVDGEKNAVLGEHLIKGSGISQKVEELAAQFKMLAKSRTFYTWVAYADDENGSGITLDPTGKEYMGIAANRTAQEIDISDPSIFAWSKIKGEPGEPGKPGDAGISPVSIVTLYCLSTSSEQAIGTWTETMPEWVSGSYIWQRQAVTWSDGSTTYTDPVLSTALNHASEAAELAQQQATTAAESATSAERAAANADTQAQQAATSAANAETLAQGASDKASQAQNEAAAAQSSADAANADIAQINKDIASVREDVNSQLKTVTKTMEAQYSKKTELTDIQGELQTQITKNAAGIEVNTKAVESVRIDASNAVQNANDAKEKADSAQTTADAAKLEAAAAQTAADTATAAAQAAQNEATTAQTAADEAKTAATKAQAVADAADKDLTEAKQNLEDVTSRVGATEADIAAAQEAVDTAQAAADQAKDDATRAANAATAAQSTADTAKANAASAQSAASKAQTDADNAKTAADNAQAAADKALADLATMGDRVTQAETDIQKNAKAISLTATKDELTDKLSRYYTKTESDAKFKVTADAIASSVKSIKVGGRNYLNGSSDVSSEITFSGWQYVLTGSLVTVSDELIPKLSIGSYLTLSAYLKNKTDTNDVGLMLTIYYTADDGTSKYKQYTSFGTPTGTDGQAVAAGTSGFAFVTAPIEVSPIEKIAVLLRHSTKATEASTVDVRSVILEIGNTASDWKPSPEDVDDDIDTAQSAADSAATSADDALRSVSEAESKIAQLADAISTLVTDANGTSLMTQTADGGWTFQMGETSQQIADIADKLNNLDTKNTEEIEALKKELEALNSLTNYVNITTSGDQPCIELGERDNDYKLLITNTETRFMEGPIVLATFNNEALKAGKVIVTGELDAVGVVFRRKKNGNVSLSWRGEE